MADTDDEYASEGISGRSTDDEGCSCILFSKHLVVKLTGRYKSICFSHPLSSKKRKRRKKLKSKRKKNSQE
jgi:hypothetical protein